MKKTDLTVKSLKENDIDTSLTKNDIVEVIAAKKWEQIVNAHRRLKEIINIINDHFNVRNKLKEIYNVETVSCSSSNIKESLCLQIKIFNIENDRLFKDHYPFQYFSEYKIEYLDLQEQIIYKKQKGTFIRRAKDFILKIEITKDIEKLFDEAKSISNFLSSFPENTSEKTIAKEARINMNLSLLKNQNVDLTKKISKTCNIEL